MHDEVHPPLQVVEHHHLFRHHQQDIGRVHRVRVRAGIEAWLDIAHGVVAEIADQPAGEARHAEMLGDLEALLKGFDPGQWISRLGLFNDDPIALDEDAVTVDLQHRATGQTDDRVAAPFLAALHGLEQIAIGGVGELQITAERGVEVGEHLADQRNAVMALRGEGVKILGGHRTDSRRCGI